MNILVNATPLLAPITGIGQYVRQLFSAIENLPNTQLYMFYGFRCEKGVSVPTPGAVRSIQSLYGLTRRFLPNPRVIKRALTAASFRHHSRSMAKNCLYHEPNFLAEPFDGPIVSTVHDLSCFDHPDAHPRERVNLMQKYLPAAIERSDQIITISNASALALQNWFHVDSSRISVTYLAADDRFRPQQPSQLQEKLADFGLLPGRYILSVGTLEPRKNLGVLFQAYAGLPNALRQRYPLVVAGMNGWMTNDLRDSVKKLIDRGELRLLGYVADDSIPALHAGAAAFGFPSRYEGFGLPVLEAMASGIPVVAANLTSLPEVIGDAGLMYDPDDVDGFREGLRQLLEDKVFAEDLGQRGLVRARTFSWRRCAEETFAVYGKVLDQRVGCP